MLLKEEGGEGDTVVLGRGSIRNVRNVLEFSVTPTLSPSTAISEPREKQEGGGEREGGEEGEGGRGGRRGGRRGCCRFFCF